MTDTKLIADLQPYAKHPIVNSIIVKARNNLYHDYKSSIATPKLLLMQHLSVLLKDNDNNIVQLANRCYKKVTDGDYDEESNINQTGSK